MQLIDTFANEACCQATVAARALADAGDVVGFGFGDWDSAVFPAEGAFGNPASLTVGWSDPNLHTTAGVIDLQSPLSFELLDIAIGNDDSLNWIDDNQVDVAKNQFWTHPQQVAESCYQNCDCEIQGDVSRILGIENELAHKEGIQQKGNCGPDQIGFWSEDCIHRTIIAGNPADGIGK